MYTNISVMTQNVCKYESVMTQNAYKYECCEQM